MTLDTTRAMGWLTLLLVVAAAVVLWPFAPWLVLAVWSAALLRGLHGRLSRGFGGRPKLAAAATMVLAALVVVPVLALLTLLVADAIELIRQLVATDRAQELLRRLVSRDASAPSTDLVDLVVSQSARVWAIGQQVAGTAVRAIVGMLILVVGAYSLLVDGTRWYGWIEEHAPISRTALRRLADAFVETGRGLFVGSVGASLAQAIVGTIVYVALGVPQPFTLGLLTLGVSVVPALGTALVWAPVAAGLALTGRPGAATILAIAGLTLIGTVDNLVRPYLARRGSLQLPTYLVLVAMFGGIVVMGPWGLFMAPLLVRLAKEALAIRRDEQRAT
jgi:predicted PurR-regulated permease PerM